MYDNFNEENVNLENKFEYQAIERFLDKNGLSFEACTHTVRITNHKGEITGTGSADLATKVIKGVAVDEKYRESVVFSKIISNLLEYFATNNVQHCFVFTKPASVQSFVNLGFKEIERAEPLVALLEYGLGSIDEYKNYLKSKQKGSSEQSAGAVIVNCNPFTLGHRYLIETAAGKCDVLYVIVLEEDRSVFPFKVRWDLIKKGVSDLSNVVILKGGDYVISSSTFPSYFLKAEAALDIAKAQAELDVRIFARHLAPILNIHTRFVGTEDYCLTTAGYNQAMAKVLPAFGISLEIITRKKFDEKTIISASYVRKGLKEGDWDLIKKLVPKTTYQFLKSDEAYSIIEKLMVTDTRH